MPLSADLSPPARGHGPDGVPFFGARWAVRLCAALLVFFALTVAIRYLLPAVPARVETIIQQPVTPEISAAANPERADTTAPDPGDSPP